MQKCKIPLFFIYFIMMNGRFLKWGYICGIQAWAADDSISNTNSIKVHAISGTGSFHHRVKKVSPTDQFANKERLLFRSMVIVIDALSYRCSSHKKFIVTLISFIKNLLGAFGNLIFTRPFPLAVTTTSLHLKDNKSEMHKLLIV